jgi:hypothetical protein
VNEDEYGDVVECAVSICADEMKPVETVLRGREGQRGRMMEG